MDDFPTFAASSILVACAMAFLFGYAIGIDQERANALENNCAQYHPQTGEFEWIKK